MPAVSVSSTSLSAFSAVATLQATSSIVRLKASPVGEKPSGESSTSPPLASTKRRASVSTLRTTPVSCRSTPSMMPIGRAVTKLPLMTRTFECAIGVEGRPCEKAASISRRISPAASFAHSSAAASVMRRSLWNCESMPFSASCACTCGREPCTSTMRIPIALSSETSWIRAVNWPLAIRPPEKAMTKVRPRCACT